MHCNRAVLLCICFILFGVLFYLVPPRWQLFLIMFAICNIILTVVIS